jgi:hypothetical protein
VPIYIILLLFFGDLWPDHGKELALIQRSRKSYNNNRSRHRPFLECRDPNYNRNDENGGSNAIIGRFSEEPPKNKHKAKDDDVVNSITETKRRKQRLERST